jgi:DNA-binding transcriptional LysR family regulator
VELRHLRYFVAVAEEEHVGRAAERLRVAQPALSRQIQDLERDVGVALFTREKKRLRLTDAGRDFLRHAAGLLAQADCAIRSAQRVARGLSGELVVGFVEAAMVAGALPAALARLGARAPLVRVELREATSVEQVDALCRKALDVALVYVAPRDDDPLLASELLWPDPLAAVLPPGHALAGRAAVTLAELGATSGGLPLVTFRRALAPERHDDVLRACAAGGYAPDRVQETTQFQSVVSLAAGGVGVGLAPASFRALVPAGATVAAVSDLAVPFGVHLVTRRDNPLPAVDAFAEEVRAAAAAVTPPRAPLRLAR